MLNTIKGKLLALAIFIGVSSAGITWVHLRMNDEVRQQMRGMQEVGRVLTTVHTVRSSLSAVAHGVLSLAAVEVSGNGQAASISKIQANLAKARAALAAMRLEELPEEAAQALRQASLPGRRMLDKVEAALRPDGAISKAGRALVELAGEVQLLHAEADTHIEGLIDAQEKRGLATIGSLGRSTLTMGWASAWVGVASAVFIVCLLLLASRTIVASLHETDVAMESIASGSGGLKVRLRDDRADELGSVARKFNRFVGQLQDSFAGVRRSSGVLAETAGGVRESSESLVRSLATMRGQSERAGSSVEALAENLRQVARSSEDAAANVSASASASEQMSKTVEVLAERADEMSGGIGKIAGAVEEITASIGAISDNCGQAAQASTASTERSRKAQEQAKQLGVAASEISSVVELIRGIAAQTNLLALNATRSGCRWAPFRRSPSGSWCSSRRWEASRSRAKS